MTNGAQVHFDSRLSAVLRPEAEAAPLPPDLLAVPDAWVGEHSWRSVTRGALAVGTAATAVAVTLAVIGVASGLEVQAPSAGAGSSGARVGITIQHLDLDPRTTAVPDPTMPDAAGAVVEVVRGFAGDDQFASTVYTADSGAACVVLQWSTSGGACGALPDEGSVFGVVSAPMRATANHALIGLVATRAARVQIETTAGPAEATLVTLAATGLDAQLFVGFLSANVEITGWAALDESAQVIERSTLPGPMP